MRSRRDPVAWRRRRRLVALVGSAGPVRRSRRGALVVAVAVAVAGCSSDGPESATTSTVVGGPSASTVPESPADGVLTLGILTAPSDSGVRDSLLEAELLAVDRINDAGGVLGRPVRVVRAEEGATLAAAAAATENLVRDGVDAIIGPNSSTTAIGVVERAVAAGVVTCSPTASTLVLDEFPDADLFFRTMPSDSLQAQALALTVQQTGASSASILYTDDLYGRRLADAVESRLADVELVDRFGFAADADPTQLEDVASAAARSGAPVVVVVAAANESARALAALGAAPTDALTDVVVNGPIRAPVAAQSIALLDPAFRRKVIGVAPQAEAGPDEDEFDPPGPYATQAYDCVNLVALAALQAGTDEPAAIAREMASVSASGSVCRDFEQCAAGLADERQIDYNGPAGLTELRVRGDAARARFDRFSFDVRGATVWESSFVVES